MTSIKRRKPVNLRLSPAQKMQSFDADIPKIALMPQSTSDVLTLLAATPGDAGAVCRSSNHHDVDGKTGVISRLAGEVSRSAATFLRGKSSAPGQSAIDLRTVLTILHQACCYNISAGISSPAELKIYSIRI